MTAKQESPHSYSSTEVETDVNVTGRKLELHRSRSTVSGKVGFRHRGGNVETGGADLHHRGRVQV